jgi:hypothetical protein
MINLRQIFIISLIMVFILPATSLFSESFTKQSDEDFLKKESDRFSNYAEDFTQFGKSQLSESNYSEGETASRLLTVATLTNHYSHASWVLLAIYKRLCCNTDRANMKPVIKGELNFYAGQVGIYIDWVNNEISYTKVPAIAVSGTKMKEDMREIKSRLESIELQ